MSFSPDIVRQAKRYEVKNANDPSVSMSLYQDIIRYMMFMGDTGLFATLAFMDKTF